GRAVAVLDAISGSERFRASNPSNSTGLESGPRPVAESVTRMNGSTSTPIPLLEMRQVVKTFPGVLANDHVDLVVQEGEIHALVGENGAGKSTLMHVLTGLFQPDSGEILFRGQPVKVKG